MTVHVILGCDGEVFATLLTFKAIGIEDAMAEFGTQISRLIDGVHANGSSPMTRTQALTVLARADFSKELDPDAESFVAFLIHDYGMELVTHEAYQLPN